jgi:competence protein CoiA
MLVAQSGNGKQISLLSSWNKDELSNLINQDGVFCPVCKGKVVLKSGNKKRWHFAHQVNKACRAEGETSYHMDGKIQLFHWLKRSFQIVKLECYLKELSQRPDIFFEGNQKSYALEFQCASISPQLMLKRTQSFIKSDIKPIWILGEKRLKTLGESIFTLTEMDYLATFTSNHNNYLLYYCPHKKRFTILTNIISFSERRIIATKFYKDMNDVLINDVLKFNKRCINNLTNQWNTLKQKWRLSCHLDKSKASKIVRDQYYQHKIPLSLIPSICGVPVKESILIKTPSHYWQGWIVVKFILNKQLGVYLHLSKVCEEFSHCVKQKIFQLRTAPLLGQKGFSPIYHYFIFLCQKGYLKKISKYQFMKVRHINIPKSIEDAINEDLNIIKHT